MKKLSPPFIGLTIGVLVFWAGANLRMTSPGLAWPQGSYSFSGPRGETGWAVREAAYNDIAIALLALGVGLLLVSTHAVLRIKREVS